MESNDAFQYSGLEAMLKGLGAFEDEALLALIKERCGVDLKRPKRDYSASVSENIVNTVQQYYFPDLSKHDGLVELGRATARGYNQTIIGQVQSAALKIVTIDRALHLLVKMLNSNVSFGERSLVKVDEHVYIIQFRGDLGNAYFAEGIIKQFLINQNIVQAVVKTRLIDDSSFDIKISW